ncbi:MAG: efflux transporter outer membrane subunit [Pirellulales bacterium]
MVLPSCCIPQLDRPLQGPALPEDFSGLNGGATADGTDLENVSQLGWRQFFNDARLSGLIEQAMVGNQELRILAQEIRIAQNEIMARQGEYLPFVTAGAGAGLEKPSLYTPLGTVEDQLQPVPGVSFPDPLPDFLIATNISWQVDIWRKLRNARDAAALRYLGTRDGQNYVVTRLVAEVAENYYELMALDNRLATLENMIAIQEHSLEVAKLKKASAKDTELAVQRFEAEVRKNQSEKLIIQQRIVEVENRINFIVGRFPQRVDRQSTNFVDLNLTALSVGVPAQLLRNRADIRQAERELAAAGLDVRVARARFFPTLDITAGVGYQAFHTKYLFLTPESLVYNVAGELVAPVINKKAIRADYLSANAKQLQAVYNYQRIVLNAYTEVINRMAKVVNYGTSIQIKKQQVRALEASVDSATKLFQAAFEGADYMDVLLAQRDLMEARMVLIETKQQQLAAIVNAYQALGGGGMLPAALQFGNALDMPMPPDDMESDDEPGQGNDLFPSPPSVPESLPSGPNVLPMPTVPNANGGGAAQAPQVAPPIMAAPPVRAAPPAISTSPATPMQPNVPLSAAGIPDFARGQQRNG